MIAPRSGRPTRCDIFLVAGEESGDRLGAALIRALRERAAGPISVGGVGGPDNGC